MPENATYTTARKYGKNRFLSGNQRRKWYGEQSRLVNLFLCEERVRAGVLKGKKRPRREIPIKTPGPTVLDPE